jgi:hypothetical protein
MLCIKYTCAKCNVNGIEDVGYGKGYVYLSEYFNELLKACDKCIAAGINVVFTAHAFMRKFEQPDEMGAYDRWELKVSKKIAPLIKEWTDILCFMKYEQVVIEENGRNKAKGKAKRIMIFNHRPTCDAKNRFGLEDDLPLSFEPLRGIYEGVVEPQPQPEILDIDNPHEGIVTDDMREDSRGVLLRKLKEQGIQPGEFGAWLAKTERPAIAQLSGTAVKSMLDNIDVLIEQIKGGKN